MLDNDALPEGACLITITRPKDEMTLRLTNSDDVENLERQIQHIGRNGIWATALTVEITQCSFKNESAKRKLTKLLLEVASKNFNIIELSGPDNIFDQKTLGQFKSLSDINGSFALRKPKVSFISALMAGLLGALLFYPLGNVLFAAAGWGVVTAAYGILKGNDLLQSNLLKGNPHKTIVSGFFLAALPLAVAFPWSFPFALLGSISGLRLNHIRDNLIKEALNQYDPNDSPEVDEIVAEEIDSFKHGLEARKGFAPLYWAQSTWKHPKPYYQGYYSVSEELKPKTSASRQYR